MDIWGAKVASAVVCACSAVIQKEDDEGKVGVKIGKELMKVAGMALKVNITRLGPKVLPISEQLIFAGNFVLRKVRAPSCNPSIPKHPRLKAQGLSHPHGLLMIIDLASGA